MTDPYFYETASQSSTTSTTFSNKQYSTSGSGTFNARYGNQIQNMLNIFSRAFCINYDQVILFSATHSTLLTRYQAEFYSNVGSYYQYYKNSIEDGLYHTFQVGFRKMINLDYDGNKKLSDIEQSIHIIGLRNFYWGNAQSHKAYFSSLYYSVNQSTYVINNIKTGTNYSTIYYNIIL